MKRLDTIAELRATLDAERASGRTVGFVPTMGFLHEGHVSLIRRARAADDVVVVSVFVNPLQFGPTEDLDAYPRDLARDSDLLEVNDVDYLFAPSVDEMYPGGMLTTVSVGGEVTHWLEAVRRPGHFDGVATVVAKLFAIVGACRAYFGEKDWQQVAVVRRMTADLSLPVEVVPCPTVRAPDGLALSSRNVYLTDLERDEATVLFQALNEGVRLIRHGERDAIEVRTRMQGMITCARTGELDYAEVVDADTFEIPDPLAGNLRLLVAARFGRARLIDNVGVTV
ncbi:MAG TPA: pantoate--beta-alanine ligase [Acidimicrobiales bacterium]|nr:pantoate--beta-alanine ligase [Acidimicrobiales bacterium]